MSIESPSSVLQSNQLEKPRLVDDLMQDLLSPNSREQALFELSKHRETYPDLASMLWHSSSLMALLIQEIIDVYPYLNPAELTTTQSNRVCNALALLQTVASNSETRVHLLNAHIPLYLYPFLNTPNSSREFDCLRLTSLGVIGALVKADDEDVIKFVLNTEIVPLCLKIMDKGIEISRTVATFIVQKVIQIDIGLKYVCATPERFVAVSNTLKTMVSDKPSPRLLKHIIRCYLRLTDHLQARDALQQQLPTQLRDATFKEYLNDDVNMRKWLYQLLLNVSDPYVTAIHQKQESLAC